MATKSYVVAGQHSDGSRYRPPLDHVVKWAAILGLKGEDRRDFLLSALCEYAPGKIREVVEGLTG